MKVMLSLRIEEALRGQLELEAQSEQRNLTNMLEVILGQRYAALGAGSGVPGVEHAGTETPGSNLPEPAPSAAKDSAGANGNQSKRGKAGASDPDSTSAVRSSQPKTKKCQHPLHGRSGWKCPECGVFTP